MVRRSTNVRNSAWNLANILIYPVAFLAATPFFIDHLGESTFGEWMLINSYVFISVHLIGFGLPDSITAHVAQAIGLQHKQKLYAYINASGRLLGRMTILTLLFGGLLILAEVLDFTFFSLSIWKALILATFIISLKFPEILIQSIFKGFERYDLFALLNITTRTLALILQIVLVALGYSLVEMYAGSLLVLFVMLIVQVFMVLRMIPGFRPSFIKALPERNEIYHFGFWSWLQTVISLIAYQMDRFIIAWFLGTATVTYYVLASTITNHLHMAFVAAVSWLLPKISRLKAALNDTKKHFYTIRTFSIGFSLLIIATLYFVSEPLFTLWLGHEKYLKFVGFFRLFLIFEAFLVLSIVPNQYLNAIKSLSFSTALEFIFKSGIVVFMILFFSIAGTAESLIWGQITALVLFMPLEYYLVNDRILKGNAFKETVLAMLPSFFISAAILWTNWIGTAVLFSLGCLSYYLVYLRDEHFERRLLTE